MEQEHNKPRMLKRRVEDMRQRDQTGIQGSKGGLERYVGKVKKKGGCFSRRSQDEDLDLLGSR